MNDWGSHTAGVINFKEYFMLVHLTLNIIRLIINQR